MPNKKQNVKKILPKISDMEKEYNECLKSIAHPVLNNRFVSLRSLLLEQLPPEKYLDSKKRFNRFFETFMLVIKQFKGIYKKNLELIHSSDQSPHHKEKMTSDLNNLTWQQLSPIFEFDSFITAIHMNEPEYEISKSEHESIMNVKPDPFFRKNASIERK